MMRVQAETDRVPDAGGAPAAPTKDQHPYGKTVNRKDAGFQQSLPHRPEAVLTLTPRGVV